MVSYKKLWKLLIDKEMSKKELAEKAGLSTYTLTKMNKGDSVKSDTLVKICKALKADAEAVVLFTYRNGSFSVFISRRIYSLGGENKHGKRAVDNLLRELNTLNEVVLLIYYRRHKLRRIDLSVVHLEEMRASRNHVFKNFLGVVYSTHSGNSKSTVM